MEFNKIIMLFDSSGNIILKDELKSVPLKEEYIIKKSIELFNDSEPCIIHRNFVIKKILLEIDTFFSNALREGKTEINKEQIPENILNMLDIKNAISKICINEKNIKIVDN